MHDPGVIGQAVRALFDVPVGFGLTDPRALQPALLPGEGAHVTRATPARKTEFAAGRAAARRAMADAGLAPQAVPALANRLPQWPLGIAGSITHTSSLCLAVVSDQIKAIGLDAEPLHAMDEDIISTICSERELDGTDANDRPYMALTIFSAKEAAYKAQFPLTGALFGFDTLDVAVDRAAGRFTATFLHAVAPFVVGDCLPGRFVEVAGHLVTGISIGHPDPKGA